MSAEVTSTNPVVQAIVTGKAPAQAQLLAARGMLPLAQNDLLELLVFLRATSDSEEIKTAAETTLEAQEDADLQDAATANETPASVLAYLASRQSAARELHEALILNTHTPDTAIAALAAHTAEATLLELIAINQQRLIRHPAIIDAVLANQARTPEAERRVAEVRREFFEKERGAQQIADEMRARGMSAAAEFVEAAESIGVEGGVAIEDAWLIAEHIEVSDADIDDSWLPLERLEEIFAESEEQRLTNAERVLAEISADTEELAPERVALIRRVMLMSVKDRVKLAMKGDREARSILIRDSNRIVATAVIHNPRITDHEVEGISGIRTVTEEVLRLIAMNRQWARQYPIIHNLARNPRTPQPTAIQILPRLRAKDLQNLSLSRNVSEAVRRQAYRLSQVRGGH